MIIKIALLILFGLNVPLAAYEAGQSKQGKQIIRSYNYLRGSAIINLIIFITILYLWDY